jgi:DNA polymerase-3 subunit beta
MLRFLYIEILTGVLYTPNKNFIIGGAVMTAVLQISKKALAEAFKVLQTDKAIPVLECVRLSISQNVLTLEGYDGDICSVVKLPIIGNVNKDLKVLVSKKVLQDIIKKLKDKDIVLAISENEIIINSTIRVKTEDNDMLEEYPNMFYIPENKTVVKTDLLEAINKVKYAMTKDIYKFHINAVCINQNEVVAVDGHRLAVYKLDYAVANDMLLIPYKTVNLISKLKVKNDIVIYYDKDNILFEMDNIMILSNRLDNKFPNYHDVIPSEDKNNIIFKVNKQLLTDAIEKSIIANDNEVKSVIFEIINNRLVIKSNSRYNDFHFEMPINIDIIKSNINNLRIGFNAKYLLEALSCVNNEAIFKIIDSDSQITLLDMQDSKYLALVMPITLDK